MLNFKLITSALIPWISKPKKFSMMPLGYVSPISVAIMGERGATHLCLHIYFIHTSGGFRGRRGRTPPMARKFLNFMQFFGKFGNFVCWHLPWMVGAPSYGESWIRPCTRPCSHPSCPHHPPCPYHPVSTPSSTHIPVHTPVPHPGKCWDTHTLPWCMLGYTPPLNRMTDTRLWKHYLPANSGR